MFASQYNVYRQERRRRVIPNWHTVVKNMPADDRKLAGAFMESLARFAKTADIPKSAIWKAYRRGIGTVVTAEWEYGAPGAVPALEVDLIGGVQVVIEDRGIPKVKKEGENGD